MIQFTRPSVGSKLYQPCSATGSMPAFIMTGYQPLSIIRRGFRPLQTGRQDVYENKPCYHLNLKGDIAILHYGDGVYKDVQYNFQDEACTIPFNIRVFQPKLKTWSASHFAIWGSNMTFGNTTYFKYKYSAYLTTTVRRLTTTYIKWVSSKRLRYEVWYEEYDITLKTYRTKAFIQYYEFDLVQTKVRSKLLSINVPGAVRPSVAFWITPTSAWTSYSSARYTVTNQVDKKVPNLLDFLERLRPFRIESMAKESFFFGQLTVRSAQALRVVKVNIFSFLIEQAWLGAPLKNVKAFVKEFLKQPSSKQLSSAFLGYQYGIKLTILDILALFSKPRSSVGFDPTSWTSSRSQMNDQSSFMYFNYPFVISHQYYQKLYCQRHPSVLVDAWARLMSVGAYPFLETAWDLIPFSFVVDWFTRFSDVLEVADSYTILNSYTITSHVTTRKSSATLPFEKLFPEWQGEALGDITIVDYNRTVGKIPPPIRLDLTPNSFTHWVEGAALIVQNR